MVSEVLAVLQRQLPRYFRPIIEFRQLLASHAYGCGQVEQAAKQLQNNFYIEMCDEATIAYYEKLLGIESRTEDPLEFRRTRVIQKLNMVVPFSVGFLRDRLTELYGEDGYIMSVDPVACILNIKVTSDRYGAINLLYDLLWDIIPAHIKIIANQESRNTVPGRVYAGGVISGIIHIQTIYYQTIYDVDAENNVGSCVSQVSVYTIRVGGEEYGSI